MIERKMVPPRVLHLKQTADMHLIPDEIKQNKIETDSMTNSTTLYCDAFM